ncbi:MAG TPA: helix-turn-helix domain-containing protein, partial [Candidatus Acidoferrum sp.]|nr:helix-turn-helix domain-containing protein [Candidatus Acidoferrum sp.]
MTRPPSAAQRPERKCGATRSAETQAAALRRTRLEHAAETAQDYVEAIADLSATQGEARAVDLARRLGVTHVTVIRTIARLQRDGYVSTRPYRSIFLTDKGSRLADESRRRHEIVLAFLRGLGVP